MPPIFSGNPIVAAKTEFLRSSESALLARLQLGKTSFWDDEPPARKTRGVNFHQVMAAGSVSEASRLGFPVALVDGVAVITLSGAMDRYGDWYGQASTAETTVAVVCARLDPAVAATVIVVDSPGGSVDGLAELGDAVKAHAAVKPFYAQVQGGAYSAGYYTIAHATAIYANRLDEVGSIGTIMGTWDQSKYFADLGIEAVVIATGKFKGAGFPGAPITQDQRDEWMRGVQTYFADFKKQIQVGREMTTKQVADIADGRYWTAPEAVDLGLVDKIQGMEATMATALKVAGNASKVTKARQAIAAVLGSAKN